MLRVLDFGFFVYSCVSYLLFLFLFFSLSTSIKVWFLLVLFFISLLPPFIFSRLPIYLFLLLFFLLFFLCFGFISQFLSFIKDIDQHNNFIILFIIFVWITLVSSKYSEDTQLPNNICIIINVKFYLK